MARDFMLNPNPEDAYLAFSGGQGVSAVLGIELLHPFMRQIAVAVPRGTTGGERGGGII